MFKLSEKDGDEVNIRDMVLLDGKLGKFESVYLDKMNIRLLDGQLFTVDKSKVKKADEAIQSKHRIMEGRDELIVKAKDLKEALKEHGLSLEVRQMSMVEKKQYEDEKAAKAAATNIDAKGNVVTEVKKEPVNEPTVS